jgi:drug/metabolite transporter (DMT)-like permease
LNIRPYTFQDGRLFLPASIFFALHATLSLYAIHGMNIPMYGAIKRCTPLVSLILSVLVRKYVQHISSMFHGPERNNNNNKLVDS